MAATNLHEASTDAADHHDDEYYLPATAGLTSDPGPVERVLTSLFRRRGYVPGDSLRRSR